MRARPAAKTIAEDIQAVLPHVRVAVTETGVLDVTVDGAEYPPPARGEWTRGTFADLLDAVTENRSIGVRIEVREVDGSVFTDLIQPRTRTRPAEPEPAQEPARPARKKKGPALVEVTADGFLAGEDVAVAIIVSHTDATNGRARALLDLNQLPPAHGGRRDVLLLGRISGTTHIEALS
ncbi:hypothetical protein ACX1DX_03520 [Tessaracoccus sp. Y36]|uniref:Uncharacterized protein n=1 Tax=Microbacterium ginsengisoli TaxID=400772 RepID=A0A0F0LYE8_9MICO|nr:MULTISPECIES: hypothetical protein [Actinomycetes]KJL36416.1 hypothetical protein RR49_01752 [Microbacterium ginsengisoli]MDI9960456.1 hypothetical protein [Rhodococcus sp. IEGM 1237]MDI9966292.1 hypothetical protein [Rhodococcus sp. IEGM 1251]MDV8128628.1 hypothetical protein [Rhodococcus sp. IEGM 1304]MEE1622451.1 hypothetical protein [Zafaria sp. J156]